jgi:abortive infection bacteriophage resistance protein
MERSKKSLLPIDNGCFSKKYFIRYSEGKNILKIFGIVDSTFGKCVTAIVFINNFCAYGIFVNDFDEVGILS